MDNLLKIYNDLLKSGKHRHKCPIEELLFVMIYIYERHSIYTQQNFIEHFIPNFAREYVTKCCIPIR